MKDRFNWDDIFPRAHLFSWPTASLSISNAEPTLQQRDQGKRNVYREDEKAILQAALNNGYKIISPVQARVVSFLNPTKGGTLYSTSLISPVVETRGRLYKTDPGTLSTTSLPANEGHP